MRRAARDLGANKGLDVVTKNCQAIYVRISDGDAREVHILELSAAKVHIFEAGAAKIDVFERGVR